MKIVALMRRNGETAILSSDSIDLSSDKEMANLTSIYKLCSTQFMLLYHEVDTVILIFTLSILIGWLEKITELEPLGTTAMK